MAIGRSDVGPVDLAEKIQDFAVTDGCNHSLQVLMRNSYRPNNQWFKRSVSSLYFLFRLSVTTILLPTHRTEGPDTDNGTIIAGTS